VFALPFFGVSHCPSFFELTDFIPKNESSGLLQYLELASIPGANDHKSFYENKKLEISFSNAYRLPFSKFFAG